MATSYKLPVIPEGNEENTNIEIPNAVKTDETKQGIINKAIELLSTTGRTAAIFHLLENGLVKEAIWLMNKTGKDIGSIAFELVKVGRTLDAARLIIESGRTLSSAVNFLMKFNLVDAARGAVIDTVLRKRAVDRKPLNVRDTNDLLIRFGISQKYIEEKREEVRGLLRENKSSTDLSLILQKHGLVTEKRELIMSVARVMKDKGARPEVIKSFLESYGIESEHVNVSRVREPIAATEVSRPPGGSPDVSPSANRTNAGEVAPAAAPAVAPGGPPGASPLRNLTNAGEVTPAAAPAAAPAANRERIEQLLNSAASSHPSPPEVVEESPLETYNRISSLIDRIDLDGPSVVNLVSRNATRNIPSLRQRDQRRGWLGPKESQSSYAKYLKDVLLTRQRELYANPNVSSSRNPYIETIKRLARVPKSSPSAVFNAFKAWRDVTISSITDTKLKDAISEVRAPGWFGVSKNYIPTILNLVKHYEEGLSYVPPTPPVRRNAWRLRGFTRKAAPVPKQAAAPESAPIQKPHEALPGVPVVLTQEEYKRRQAAGLAGGARRTRKTAAPRRMAHKHSRRCRHSRQRGGATPMPLAYYQLGAYETRTTDVTGAGIAGSSDSWVRTPVSQTGGRRMTRRAQRQSGGFSPSVMGQFASAGLRLLPVAGYMGYKMFSKKSRKASRKAGRRTRRR